MKVIIAGSRTLNPTVKEIADIVYDHRISISEIVSGTAAGVDTCGEAYAKAAGQPIAKFPPEWDEFGKLAGPIRNKQMAEYADALILIWDGKSRGSANMKKQMQKLNKPIFEKIYD